MGLIQSKIREYLGKKKHDTPKTEIQKGIEEQRRNFKQEQRIDAVMQYERNSFLHGKWNNEE